MKKIEELSVEDLALLLRAVVRAAPKGPDDAWTADEARRVQRVFARAKVAA